MRHLPKFCLHLTIVTEVLQFNETFTEVLPSFYNNRVVEVLRFNETFTEVLPSFFNNRVIEVLRFNETFTEVLPSFFNIIGVTKVLQFNRKVKRTLPVR